MQKVQRPPASRQEVALDTPLPKQIRPKAHPQPERIEPRLSISPKTAIVSLSGASRVLGDF